MPVSIFGIATYSYKRLLEVVDHKLFNSISGRGAVRVLIENYIMMKYLVSTEKYLMKIEMQCLE